jgi:hypothetical protein
MIASHVFAFALSFVVCVGDGEHLQDCEEGTTWARSCAQAEAHVRAGLRPHQTLHIWGCRRVYEVEVRR